MLTGISWETQGCKSQTYFFLTVDEHTATYSTGVYITVDSYRPDAHFPTSLDHLMEKKYNIDTDASFYNQCQIQHNYVNYVVRY